MKLQIKKISLIVVFSTILAGYLYSDTNAKEDFSLYKIISRRNIFRPLWRSAPEKKPDNTPKVDLEALKRAEEERKEALRKQQAQKMLEKKKRETERDYTLTGIIFEDEETQAVIQNRKRKSYFVKEGDSIEDLIVKSIDSSKGEVILDYEGKFTVSLSLE